MGFMIRQVSESAKLTDEATLAALQSSIQPSVVAAVVADLGVAERRRRKLPAELSILLSITMNLFTRQSLSGVLQKMLKGLRLIWPDPDFAIATKGAVCQARYRLGARPLAELFHRVCQPLADPKIKGAYLFGLRLMALDSTIEDVPDTPANARAFGRHRTDRGESAFPQIMAVYLIESGTHAITDAGFFPVHSNQHASAQRLLRSVSPGMLLSWDAGLHSFDIALKTRVRDAHFLGRVPASAKPQPEKRLDDGTYLANIYPSDRARRRHGEHLLVRIIEYTLTDPARVGFGEVHRLMTSLLDPTSYPAEELVLAYHERWEVEITIDELDTHQRLSLRPLRSKKPVGVIQELYGLLIAHYAIRRIMLDSARAHDLEPDRLSFAATFELVCDALSDFQQVAAEDHPKLYQRLLQDVARHPLPPRANRVNPRVVRRKIGKYNLKRAEHQHWPQPTMLFHEAVAILN